MNTLAQDWRAPRSLILLVVFLAVVIGVGASIGVVTAPGEWYASLNKPPFNPPNWLFAPVWFALYVLIAVAGWRTFLRAPNGTAMKLWYGQMVLNWLWTPTFFLLQWLWPAVVVIVAMLITMIAFILRSWNEDRPSAWMFVPYAAWVSFATLLNTSIAILN